MDCRRIKVNEGKGMNEVALVFWIIIFIVDVVIIAHDKNKGGKRNARSSKRNRESKRIG